MTCNAAGEIEFSRKSLTSQKVRTKANLDKRAGCGISDLVAFS